MAFYYPIEFENHYATLVVVDNDVGILFPEEKPINLRINELSIITVFEQRTVHSARITYRKDSKLKPVVIEFLLRAHCEDFISMLIDQNLIVKCDRKRFCSCCCIFSARPLIFRKRTPTEDNADQFEDFSHYDTIVFALS